MQNNNFAVIECAMKLIPMSEKIFSLKSLKAAVTQNSFAHNDIVEF